MDEIMNTLLLQSKAIVAQSLYGSEYYYHVITPLNDELQTAIRFMNKTH